MACIISVGDGPEAFWSLKNGLFSSFVQLVAEQCSDAKVEEQVRLSEVLNGICLERLQAQDPNLADEIAVLFQRVAHEASAGTHDDKIADPAGVVDITAIRRSYGELAGMLASWLSH